jgi:hypothetical protein
MYGLRQRCRIGGRRCLLFGDDLGEVQGGRAARNLTLDTVDGEGKLVAVQC